jgi:hypothetical protein
MNSGILLLVVVSLVQQTKPEKDPNTDFTSRSAGFSIAFPGQPTESFRTEKMVSGPRIHKIFEFAEPGKSYRVICADLSKERQPRLRQDGPGGILDLYSRSLDGKVLSQKKMTFQGEPAIEVAVELQNGITRGIYLIKGKRLFQITLYYADPKEDRPDEFRQFADSFRVFAPVGNLTDGMNDLTAWKDFRSEGGGYRIKALGTPTERAQIIEMPDGPVEVKMIRFLGPKGENYGVFTSPYAKTVPPQTPEVVFESLAKGAAENVKGKVASQKPIGYMGQPGSEALISLPGQLPFVDGVYKVRMYWVGDRLYQLIYIGPRERLTTKEVLEFFDSFRINAEVLEQKQAEK